MDAALVTSWQNLCQLLAPAFTDPTAATFLQVATAWVLCTTRRTVSNLVRTIGSSLLGRKASHWITYQRFFYRATWSLQDVSLLLLTQVVWPLVQQQAAEAVADLNIDDTTCGRSGKHVALAGYFKDASVSNTRATVVHWAHNWVIGAVALRPKRWPNWVVSLPVLFTLYRKRPDGDAAHPFATRQQIAAAMLRQTRQALPQARIRLAVDGQYATHEVVKEAAARGAMMVSRMRCDAAIYELPAARAKCRRGRPPQKGKRLPAPKELARRRRKGWRTIPVTIYGREVQRQVLSIVCLWYHVAKTTPVKLLIVRDPTGKEKDDYLFCTDPAADEKEIIERFAARWPIEGSIEEGKQLGGMEEVQGWCEHTVERQAPMALVVQTLVKAWYLRHGVDAQWAHPQGPRVWKWMPAKDHPSYLDMLATLRHVLWTERITGNSHLGATVRQWLKPLRFVLCAA